jgi:hypothetical protein
MKSSEGRTSYSIEIMGKPLEEEDIRESFNVADLAGISIL